MLSLIQSIRRLTGEIRDTRNRLAFFSAILFSMLAHLYRYTNAMFSHDSLGVYRNDLDFSRQIARGRWMQPVYLTVRGRISAPFLIGTLAAVFLALSVVLIVRQLDLKRKGSILSLSGVLATWSTITAINASFVHNTDFYMFSLLLSVAAVVLWARSSHGWIPAAICYAASLGLYQCYIETGALLGVFVLLRLCINGHDTRTILKKLWQLIGSVVGGIVLYYLVWKLLLRLCHVQTVTAYNSINNSTLSRGGDYLLLLKNVYVTIFSSFQYPETVHIHTAAVCNLLLGLLFFVSFVILLRRSRPKTRVLMLLLTAFSPIAANFVYFLFGRLNSLLTFSFALYYGAGLMFLEQCVSRMETEPDRELVSMMGRTLTTLLLAILVMNATIYANQVYLKKHLDEQAALSTMTRVLAEMEDVDGYQPGETVVLLVGTLHNSDLVGNRPGYEELTGRNINDPFSLTYYRTYYFYCAHILGYPLNLGEERLARNYAERPEVAAMPAFPAEGCCRMVDGMLIVKLSPPDLSMPNG